jgi:hypothetical protein
MLMSRNSRGASRIAVAVSALFASLTPSLAQAQVCAVPALTSGLRMPLGITQSNQGNLIVSETGTLGVPHSGRISIVDADGNRRTLVDGLPSATNDVNEPAGPAGVLMRGRTLYVVIGIGDTIQVVSPGSPLRSGNPNPASPLFSSVLAIHFSANVEKTTNGFSLSYSDQQTLAAGGRVRLGGGGEKVTLELVANMPDFTPNPTPAFPANVRGGNPFDIAAIGDQLYVTDGGQNALYAIDVPTGAHAVLATFSAIPNPLFGTLGGPVVEAVPTGIRESDGQLLVTLFRGFPFPAGTSVVEQIDPSTGAHAPVIAGLKTAIDVLPVSDDGDATDHLVLQHALGPVLSGQGSLTRFPTVGAPAVLTSCLNRPTSFVRDEKTGTVYVTEIVNGRVAVVE